MDGHWFRWMAGGEAFDGDACGDLVVRTLSDVDIFGRVAVG
jgi:hypothetical protein